MRFTKKKIRFLINYFNFKNRKYRKYIRFNLKFALNLLLIKLL